MIFIINSIDKKPNTQDLLNLKHIQIKTNQFCMRQLKMARQKGMAEYWRWIDINKINSYNITKPLSKEGIDLITEMVINNFKLSYEEANMPRNIELFQPPKWLYEKAPDSSKTYIPKLRIYSNKNNILTLTQQCRIARKRLQEKGLIKE